MRTDTAELAATFGLDKKKPASRYEAGFL